jgi:hypothetical protein
MSVREEFGHPGWEWNHWLAITGVEIFKQKGREMLSVSNNRFGVSRSRE